MGTRRKKVKREHRNRYARTMIEEKPPSARRALQDRKLRKDCIPLMDELCPDGWQFDESKSNSSGWYMAESKILNVSSEQGGDLYLHHNWGHNRSFNQRHSENLSEVMEAVTQITLAIGPDNHPWVVNGQHSAWAIRLQQCEVMPVCFLIIQCRDEAAIANLFHIFDNNMIRPLSVILKAAEATGIIESSVPPSRLARWATGALIAENGFRRPTASRVAAAKLTYVKREVVQQFATFMEENFREHNPSLRLIPPGVIGAFFAMWCSDSFNAQRFLDAYLSGANLEAGHPVLKVREKMIVRTPGEHAGTAAFQHAQVIYAAWKKFCNGELMKNLTVTKMLPPYNEWKVFIKVKDLPTVKPSKERQRAPKGLRTLSLGGAKQS